MVSALFVEGDNIFKFWSINVGHLPRTFVKANNWYIGPWCRDCYICCGAGAGPLALILYVFVFRSQCTEYRIAFYGPWLLTEG